MRSSEALAYTRAQREREQALSWGSEGPRGVSQGAFLQIQPRVAGTHLLLQARELIGEGLDPHAGLLQLLPSRAGRFVVLVGAELGGLQLQRKQEGGSGLGPGPEAPPRDPPLELGGQSRLRDGWTDAATASCSPHG